MTRRYFLYQLFETLISDHLFSYRKISPGSVVCVIKIPRAIKPPQCNQRSEISLIFRAWKGIARRHPQQGVFLLFQLHNNYPGHLAVVYFMSCSPQTCITPILGGHFPPLAVEGIFAAGTKWKAHVHKFHRPVTACAVANYTLWSHHSCLAEASLGSFFFFNIPPPTLSHFKRFWSPYVNEHLWHLSQGV